MTSNRGIKYILIFAGLVSVLLGVIGIFVPVLPTTPFLLLAAFCFSRSSGRLNNWLLNNKWFGAYIRDYRLGNGIPLKIKIFAITLLWVTILLSSIFLIGNDYIRIGLVVIAAAVTVHISIIKGNVNRNRG